jgi:hypothetical protein
MYLVFRDGSPVWFSCLQFIIEPVLLIVGRLYQHDPVRIDTRVRLWCMDLASRSSFQDGFPVFSSLTSRFLPILDGFRPYPCLPLGSPVTQWFSCL